MDDRSDRDILVETATKVEGIQEDVSEVKKTQESMAEDWIKMRLKLAKMTDLPDKVNALEKEVASFKWLPKVVAGILTAIVARALWVISGVGK